MADPNFIEKFLHRMHLSTPHFSKPGKSRSFEWVNYVCNSVGSLKSSAHGHFPDQTS